jgi:hypothetical protein
MTLAVRTEAQEQRYLVQYLRFMNIPHFRVPNETYTTSFKQKSQNKALGVSRGVPDLFAIVADRLIGIEMKRVKGSSTSLDQKAWVSLLNGAGIPTRICKGYDEAIKFIEEIEKNGTG